MQQLAVAPSLRIDAGLFDQIVLWLFAATLVVALFIAICLARIFKKAGVAPWKAWIPVYNTWLTLRLGDQPAWISILTLIPLINTVAIVYLYLAMYTIGKKFGKDKVFFLYGLFLPLVWYGLLAFGDAHWHGGALRTSKTIANPDDPFLNPFRP
ncbi:MAG: DUF5684 domain-containing protein [Candidatus Saccharimonadales bacterium]